MNWYSTYAYNRTRMFEAGGAYAGQNYNRWDVMGDGEIYFKGTTTLENDVKIGVMAQLEGGTDDSFRNRMWDEVYLSVEGGYGQLLVGSHRNVTARMAVLPPTASEVMCADDTYMTRLVPISNNVSFLDSTFTKIDYLAPKTSYISPTVNNMTLAVSVTTANDTRGHDDSVLYVPGNRNYIKYGLVGLARYDKEFEEGSAVSEINTSAFYARFKPNDLVFSHAAQEVGVGLRVSFGPWSVGSSVRRFLADVRSQWNDWQGYGVNTGVMYTADRWAVSANWYASRVRGDVAVKGDDKVDLYLASAKYKLGAGVDAFVDVGYMTMKDDAGNPLDENEGVGTAVGFALTF